mgnify:CR=1 FL=1
MSDNKKNVLNWEKQGDRKMFEEVVAKHDPFQLNEDRYLNNLKRSLNRQSDLLNHANESAVKNPSMVNHSQAQALRDGHHTTLIERRQKEAHQDRETRY